MVVTSIGALTGAGTVSAKHELAFKMSAALHAGGAASEVGIPFRIEGTSDTPTFKADMKAVVGEMVKDPAKAVDAAKGLIHLFK